MKTTGHEVTRSDIIQTSDGRSKGCGIVEFATVEGAQQAVLTLNDTEVKGRQIFVREDREDHRSGSAGVAGGRGGGSGGAGSDGHRFSSGENAQSRRVYVGNLSWDLSWQVLKDHMRQAGEVIHVEIICEHNGRSKGCAIVEYATEAEAKEAVATLSHTELSGRTIFVREDRETTSAAAVPSAATAPGGPPGENTSVYVWNLSYETSWQDLKDHMRTAGNVDSATIMTNSEGSSMGCGVVIFQTAADAQKAISTLNESELKGRQIHLRENRVQPGSRSFGGRGPGRGPGRGRGAGRGGPGRFAGGKKRFPAGDKPSYGAPTEGTQLYIGNLSFDMQWPALKDLFKQCGEIERADVGRGNGTVRFTKKEDAEAAIQKFNGTEVQGRVITVKFDRKA